MRRFFIPFLLIVLMASSPVPAWAQETGFKRGDRDRLIRLETPLQTFMEQTDQHFDQLIHFLWMLVGIFTTLSAAAIGFAYCDRRTILRKAKGGIMEAIEREGRPVHLLHALRRPAREDEKPAGVLRDFGLP